MTEPTSMSGVALMTTGVGVASLLPFVNGDALVGAILGAAVVALHAVGVHWWLKIISFFISTGCGYFFGPEVMTFFNTVIASEFRFQLSSVAVVSCVIAIVCIPFLRKLSDWASAFDLEDAINEKILKNRSGKDKNKKGD